MAQLFGQFAGRRETFLQHDESLDDLRALHIGLADHRGLDDGRMLEQGALDIERTNPVARRGDHIVVAPDEMSMVMETGPLICIE